MIPIKPPNKAQERKDNRENNKQLRIANKYFKEALKEIR